MTFNKFETDSYCVRGRHRPATKKIYGSLTSKGNNLLIEYCSVCNRKKSMTVSDNTIKAERLGSFFKNLGKISAKAGKKLANNAPKKPTRFLEIGANVATAAAIRNPKTALSTLPEAISFYRTGKACTYIDLRKYSLFYSNKSMNNNSNYTNKSNFY